MKQILNEIKNEMLIPVIRTSTLDKAKLAIDACVEAGFKILEITCTIPNVDQAIQYAFKKYSDKIIIGCGTVLTIEQAKLAQKLNCQFLVAPNTNEEISNFCQQENLLYIPGVMTVNEIVKAWTMGNQMVKLFPANAFSLKYLGAIKAPLPKIQVMVTGGVDEKNFLDWLNAGAEACGIGGNLIAPIEKNDDYQAAVQLGKQYLAKVKNNEKDLWNRRNLNSL